MQYSSLIGCTEQYCSLIGCYLSDWKLHLPTHDDLEQDWTKPDDLVHLAQLLLRLIPVRGIKRPFQQLRQTFNIHQRLSEILTNLVTQLIINMFSKIIILSIITIVSEQSRPWPGLPLLSCCLL